MNLTYTRPGELRKPDVEVLPDGRIRITRYIAAGHGDRDYSEVTESVGTADKGLATALLVKRGMAQINGKDAIVKTYEVRNASSETLVGQADVQYTESGQKTMVYDFIQMSSGTYTPGTIGSTQSPDDATCILRTEQTEDDGTTRQIRRVFINKGLLQQVDETKNNGALLLKTFVYLNDAPVPNPPTGYTLISQRTENPNGLETTTYVYAKGDGQISQDDTTSNNGALLRRTIRHITAPSAANPIATPSGYTLVEEAYQDSDGHRIWTASYAKGTGEIAREIDYNNSGDQGTTGITRTTIRYLVVPSATVQPTTLAGSVEVGRSFQDADGHRIWTTVWAKGTGEINRETRYTQSIDQGTTGATVITVRYLTAISVTVNPITTPAGTVLINEEKSDQDGYRVWTAIYAKGTGTVVTDVDIRNSGKLKVHHKVALGSAPTTPSVTIVGATMNVVSQNQRNDSGYVIYDYTWAEGLGIVSERIQYRDGGLRLLNRDIFLAQGSTNYTAYTPTYGIEVDVSYSEGEGIRRYSVTWIQSNDGTNPLTNPVLQFSSKVPFTYPGRAKAYYASFTSGAYTSHKAYDVFLSPPIQSLIDATTKIYYTSINTSPSPTYTLWNPTEWATMRAKYIGWSNSPRSRVEGLKGYIASNSGASGTSSGSGTDISVMGDRVYASTDWSITLSGGPSDPSASTLTLNIEQVPAFTKTDGTQYYRVTEVYATIPAQPALPV
jgi:hypothetical protein